mmetsp:Transcript_49808/g.138070  ORF Transcript_49808/g.138070 Transcript_49808/m.138070 type:complete len:152 (-) Transcript_49808:251-706(-)
MLTVLTRELEGLVWRSAQAHLRRPPVQAACCELFAEVLREDYRRLSSGRPDLLIVHADETLQDALRRMIRYLGSVLHEHARQPQVQRPCCHATSALFAIARESERRMAGVEGERRTAAEKASEAETKALMGQLQTLMQRLVDAQHSHTVLE